jgi:hypothetical protein
MRSVTYDQGFLSGWRNPVCAIKEPRKFFSDGGCSIITTAEKACYTGNYAILLARHLSIRHDNIPASVADIIPMTLRS